MSVGAAALVLFILTLAPTVTAEDSGELIAAAWHFGIPHPPGYPLWTLLCGIFTHLLPLGSVAWRANLFSAVCSAGAAVVAYAALREVGVSRPIAAAASLTWIWSRWSWSQSVITEVYSLNSLLTVGVLWCGLRWYRTRSNRPLLAASLLMGLGMANHHSIALVGLALVIWILVQQPGLVKQSRLVLCCVAMFVVGLLPYVYLPVRAQADPPINWGDPSNAQRFWEHVSRHQYGAIGPTKVAEPRSVKRLVPQLHYLGESICDDMTPWWAGAAVVGLVVMARRNRWLLVLVILWLICTGLLFAVLANYDLDRTSRWAMRVFFIPVPLGLVIPLAFLLEWLRTFVRRKLVNYQGLATAAVIILVAAAPGVQIAAHWRQCNYAHYWLAEDHARNLLRCMLPRAMIFPSGDHNAFPLVYLVMVEGEGDDVLIADIYGYTSPELYASRPPDSPDAPLPWLIKQARRPVYYTTKKAPPVENARFVSAGLLYHLLPEGMSFDSAGLLDKCGYRNLEEPTVFDFGAAHIMTDFEFFQGLDDLEGGQSTAALAHFARAAEFGWGIREAFNNIGSALGEYGRDEEAIGYFRQAAGLDHRYTLPRWNMFRLFKRQGRLPEARRQLVKIIAAEPADFRAYGEMGFTLHHHFNDPDGAVHF